MATYIERTDLHMGAEGLIDAWACGDMLPEAKERPVVILKSGIAYVFDVDDKCLVVAVPSIERGSRSDDELKQWAIDRYVKVERRLPSEHRFDVDAVVLFKVPDGFGDKYFWGKVLGKRETDMGGDRWLYTIGYPDGRVCWRAGSELSRP